MIRLALTLAALAGPMIAASSLRADMDYWHAAHTWEHTSPATYYAHSLILATVLCLLIRKHRT